MRNYLNEVLALEDSIRVFLIVGLAVTVLLLSVIMTTAMAVGAAQQHGDKHQPVEMLGMKM